MRARLDRNLFAQAFSMVPSDTLIREASEPWKLGPGWGDEYTRIGMQCFDLSGADEETVAHHWNSDGRTHAPYGNEERCQQLEDWWKQLDTNARSIPATSAVHRDPNYQTLGGRAPSRKNRMDSELFWHSA